MPPASLLASLCPFLAAGRRFGKMFVSLRGLSLHAIAHSKCRFDGRLPGGADILSSIFFVHAFFLVEPKCIQARTRSHAHTQTNTTTSKQTNNTNKTNKTNKTKQNKRKQNKAKPNKTKRNLTKQNNSCTGGKSSTSRTLSLASLQELFFEDDTTLTLRFAAAEGEGAVCSDNSAADSNAKKSPRKGIVDKPPQDETMTLTADSRTVRDAWGLALCQFARHVAGNLVFATNSQTAVKN